MLTRLIPPAENLNLQTGVKTKNKGEFLTNIERYVLFIYFYMIYGTFPVTKKKKNFSMKSLGGLMSQIECPAQVLSLLANSAGHHIIAFGDPSVRIRFSEILYHTLSRGECHSFLISYNLFF